MVMRVVEIRQNARHGEISDKYCDLIVITEQDRRTEDIESIKNMMVQRIEKTPFVFILNDLKRLVCLKSSRAR